MAAVEHDRGNRADRVKSVVRLLSERLGYLEYQRLAQSFPSKPGAAPTAKVACGCGSLRTVEGRMEWAGSSFCPLCNGTGFRRRLAIDGAETQDERGAIFDPYTFGHDRSAKAGEEGGLRSMTSKELDRELARLRSDKRARAGVNTDAYGWERARERRDRSGSFRELDLALDALRNWRPISAALLENIFKGIYGEPGRVTNGDGRLSYSGRIPSGAAEAYWEALFFIEARMPEPIRVPQYLTDADNGAVRRAQVVETYKQTRSLGETAKRSGMRKLRVKTILKEAGVWNDGAWS